MQTVCLVLIAKREGPWVPQNWSYGWLWATMWGLEAETVSYGRAARALTEPPLQPVISLFLHMTPPPDSNPNLVPWVGFEASCLPCLPEHRRNT